MEFKEELEISLDAHFPKGDVQERGQALVLFADAVILHKRKVEDIKMALERVAREKAVILGGEGYSGIPILMEIQEVLDIIKQHGK